MVTGVQTCALPIFPGDTHKNIVYPGAVTSISEHPEETQEFLDWCLTSEKAQEIWQNWGFELA